MTSPTFRHSAGFGKRIEYWIVGLMLKEGLDVYLPLVDDDAIDAVVRRDDGSFTTVQIKARSKTCKFGNGALFAAIPHEFRDNYWFVFYSERMDKIWIMTSEEFIAESSQNKTGKNTGKRTIWLNGRRTDRKTGEKYEYCKTQFERYIASDFSRLSSPYPAAEKNKG
ncbi:hypothetical protein NT6N_25310 [Oceaniferula spumae]|uniref:DUF4365 domain-containing protein n=1 Tax=Oceaniferula spumae TaxID=2979115 RepID=A0AAT9FNC0_9BACT